MSELTYEQLISELFPRLTGRVRWGLVRTRTLLAAVGNPQRSFRTIHVGGTNGKGSVAVTLAAILRAQRRLTGLYSSPHLCTFRERIQIDGAAISEDALLAAAHKLWPTIERVSPSFFEATTAIAFLALAEAGVALSVVEVGLGGRLDATNVIKPELAIITNIALDHADYLGSTIESVAREKAGIIKPSVPLLTAERAELPLAIFRERAQQQGAPFHQLTVDDVRDVTFDTQGTRFTMPFEQGVASLQTPLIGQHQASNAALAVRASGLLPGALRPSREAVVAGVQSVKWPGRLQVEHLAGQTWLFDVAHNVAGVHALVSAVGKLKLPRPLVIVVGILGDKDWQAMLPPLFGIANLAVLTRPPTAPPNRAWNPEKVLQTVSFDRARVHNDFAAALAYAHEQAGSGTVLVTGSFHTVGDALIALGRAPYGSDAILPRVAFSG